MPSSLLSAGYQGVDHIAVTSWLCNKILQLLVGCVIKALSNAHTQLSSCIVLRVFIAVLLVGVRTLICGC